MNYSHNITGKMIRISILFVICFISKEIYCIELKATVEGDFAEIKNFKRQVSLRVKGQHFCGGIISSLHMVTAAHCVDVFYTNGRLDVSRTNKIGSGKKHNIKCIRKHPSYTGKKNDSWHDDIAVITLAKPITFNNVQGPIPLASRDYSSDGYRGIISSWGRTEVNGSSSPALKWLSVNISQNCCPRDHKNPPTIEKHICTLDEVGKSASKGDIDGILVVNGELAGIASRDLPCASGVSHAFTNVYKYLDFINESISMCE